MSGRHLHPNPPDDEHGECAMLVKLCGKEPGGDTRYSPAECIGCRKDAVSDNPDRKHI